VGKLVHAASARWAPMTLHATVTTAASRYAAGRLSDRGAAARDATGDRGSTRDAMDIEDLQDD
jgi:hypothetical protein